jgi:hypothetical protein
VFKSLPKAAEAWVQKGNIYAPRRKMSSYYERRLERYQRALEALARL